jgi:lipopolysaccharide export system permease protein
MNDGRTETRHWHLGQLELELGIGGNQKRNVTARKVKYMDLRLLCAQILLEQEEGRDTAAFLLELHRRLSMAMSPFSFLLLGLPFGIRSRRSEKSVGLLICVLLALGFYAFLQAADMLKRHTGLHPEYIIWLPNALYQAVGLWIMHRIGKH